MKPKGRPKLKPDYDRTTEIEELISTAVALFAIPYDDRLPRDEGAPSLNSVAEEMEITSVKARRLLISGGVFSTELSRRILELKSEGASIEEIMKATHLGQASVYGYLPYLKGAYKLPEPTLYAEQTRRYRERCRAVAELKERHGLSGELDYLWKAMVAFEGYPFAMNGAIIKYAVKENCIMIQTEKIDREMIEKYYKAALTGKDVDAADERIACILRRIGVVRSG